jgi:hypothetical protein
MVSYRRQNISVCSMRIKWNGTRAHTTINNSTNLVVHFFVFKYTTNLYLLSHLSKSLSNVYLNRTTQSKTSQKTDRLLSSRFLARCYCLFTLFCLSQNDQLFAAFLAALLSFQQIQMGRDRGRSNIHLVRCRWHTGWNYWRVNIRSNTETEYCHIRATPASHSILVCL